MNGFLLILTVAAGSYLLRASFIVLVGDRPVPAPISRVLPHVKPAVLAALLVATLGPTAEIGPAHVAGVVVAGLVARSGRSLIAVLAAGMAVFHLVTAAL